MSDYQKYLTYKIKYINLKNKINGGGGELMFKKIIKNLPTEYLQNIINVIITKQKLNINDFYINYVIEQDSSKPINIYIYNLKEISDDTKSSLINKLDEKLTEISL